MANIVIVSTTNSIEVDFNVLSTAVDMKAGAWRKEDVTFIRQANHVRGEINGQKEWFVSFDGNTTDLPTLQIDSIDTVPPTSNLDLYNKLKALIA